VDIGAVLRDADFIEDLFARISLEALEDSRRHGIKVADWRDGRVVWVDPREMIARVKAGMRRRARQKSQKKKRGPARRARR
jgi:hypothetical protein